MTITLELTPELEAKLRAGLLRHDSEGVRQLLADVLMPTVEAWFAQTHEPLNASEFEALADRLVSNLSALMPAGTPPLSDYAVSRAGLYEDHD